MSRSKQCFLHLEMSSPCGVASFIFGHRFGGATGILFYLCYVMNSAFNATAMVEDLISTFFKNAPSIYFTYFYHGTLLFLLLVALAGNVFCSL